MKEIKREIRITLLFFLIFSFNLLVFQTLRSIFDINEEPVFYFNIHSPPFLFLQEGIIYYQP